jgi:hypothetical protein
MNEQIHELRIPYSLSQSAISALVEVLLYQNKYYAKSTPIPTLEK